MRRAEISLAKRLVIEHEVTQVVLVRRSGANGWLLTAFENMPGASVGVATQSLATQSVATRSRNGMGAGTESFVANNSDDGNAVFSRAKLAEIKASALDMLHQTMSHPGKVSFWDKIVGTMRPWPNDHKPSSPFSSLLSGSLMMCRTSTATFDLQFRRGPVYSSGTRCRSN